MNKIDTYLIVNSSFIHKLKAISHFKLNLGQALIDNANKFMPNDLKVQKHFLYYKEIIQLVGYIGTLAIYTLSKCNINTIELCNNDRRQIYVMDDNIKLYDNINNFIDLFFTDIGLNQDISTKQPIQDPEIVISDYVKPDKKLSDMTREERVLYSRNLK